MPLDLTPRTLTLCECFKIELSGGINAYFTGYSSDLSFLGQTYLAVPIKRTEIQINTDLQVDQVGISIGLISVTIGAANYTIPQIIRYGFLRNAKVTIYCVDYTTPANYVELYTGWVRGDVTSDNSAVHFSIVSVTGRLNEIKIPRVAYQKECPWQIYDTQCGLNPDNYDESGAADANSTDRLLYDPVFAYSNHAAGYWNAGKVTFTSGDNTGISATIIKHYDGYVKFLMPLPNVIAVGAGFTAWPNCQGKGSICKDTFNNYANFLGFEYVPNPELLFV